MRSQLIYNLPNSEYRATKPKLSQSTLKVILRQSPAHARVFIDDNHDTPAMKLGRAAHCLILEGQDIFNGRYAASPECDRRTKEGKATYSAFADTLEDRETLTSDELVTINAMQTVLKSNGLTKDLFFDGLPEVSAFGQISGVDVKGRFDYRYRS